MSHRSPRLSARAIIYRDGCILLSQYEDDRGFWYVAPGGGVQHGESLEAALHREMLEELGAEVTIGPAVAIREVASLPHDEPYLPANFHQVEVFFRCELKDFVQAPHAMDPTQVGYHWMPLDQLAGALFFPDAFKQHLIARAFPKIYFGTVR
jgi:8-oxo-dGTP diphosphatase